MKTLIIGGPRTGKTTYAVNLLQNGVQIYHCDALKDTPWSEQSDHIATHWLTIDGAWVIEGTAAVRALRKYIKANTAPMTDWEIIWVDEPKVELSSGQKGMRTSVTKMWKEEIEPVVLARGANVTYR